MKDRNEGKIMLEKMQNEREQGYQTDNEWRNTEKNERQKKKKK